MNLDDKGSLKQFIIHGRTHLFVKRFGELTAAIEAHSSLFNHSPSSSEPDFDEEPLRQLFTLAAAFKNRQIVKLIMDYNVHNNNPHLNMLTNDTIQIAIESNDVEFFSFLMTNSNRGRPQDAKHHIYVKVMRWNWVNDYNMFKVMISHVHQFHVMERGIPMNFGNYASVIRSIGTPETAREFITLIGVLRDCLDCVQVQGILNDILKQYFSMELLQHIAQTFPVYMHNVDWLSRSVCSTLSHYLVYLEFRSNRPKGGMAETSSGFVSGAIWNGGHLDLLQHIHAHFIDNGETFSIDVYSIEMAMVDGSPLEVVHFLLDHHDIKLRIPKLTEIHPSLHSMELFQRLVTHPKIKFCNNTLKCLLVSGNFEVFKFLERHIHEKKLFDIDYIYMLNTLVNFQPLTSEATSLFTSIIHNHPEVFVLKPNGCHYNLQFLLNSDSRAAILNLHPKPLFTLDDLGTCIRSLKLVPSTSLRVELLQQLLDSDIIVPCYRRSYSDDFPMDAAIGSELFELLPVLSHKYPNIQLSNLVNDDLYIKLTSRDGLVESFKLLITHNALPGTSFHIRPHVAIGDLDIIQLLRIKDIPFDIRKTFNHAAGHGSLEIIKYLFKVNTTFGEAMNQAATNGHLHIVEYLIDNQDGLCKHEAFIGASRNGHLHVLKYMFLKFKEEHHQIWITLESCITMIKCAMEGGHLFVLQVIIEHNMNRWEHIHNRIVDDTSMVNMIIRHNRDPRVLDVLNLSTSFINRSLKLSIIQGHLNQVSYFANRITNK
ncbi:hypothetical protein SAMD00019534_055360 [Acytostelium subglobosum LB1]|uniref:hypothetical protein n=1 Tax=Acytostelium subglobosum LB1 TaxID=1410327 RepID=UPI000644A2AE|nr:hypothetical protein SAMD00019534_055360 [Acytostelium subglobosum LB1]GAM22361.1 hypothetical protein SAMD00019534_055360 [Acytostelium subglobosum LB1]|eukprot:XP_012754481.1 hypothetical protein SAMD00019534_055360 [Acytostelium subglobosum LB1]